MAEEDQFCPTCHSRVSKPDVPISGLSRKQGEDGEDENGDPIPRWSNDPIKTLDGYNGEDFVGTQRALVTEILELQFDRSQKELDEGFALEDRTVFSDPNIGSIREPIINELRESTEKILDSRGITLQEYLKADADGVAITENQVGPKDTFNKGEWTDTLRGRAWLHKDPPSEEGGESEGGKITGNFKLPVSDRTKASPSLKAGVRVRATHIEDLRRTIAPSWREFWSVPGDIGYNLTIGLPRSTVLESRSQGSFGEAPLISTQDASTESFFVHPLSKEGPKEQVRTGDTLNTKVTPTFYTNGKFDFHPSNGGDRVSSNISPQDQSFITPPPDLNAEDGNGNQTEPFFYDGERAWLVSGSVGKGAWEVTLNGNTNSVASVSGTGELETSCVADVTTVDGSKVDGAPEGARKLKISTSCIGASSQFGTTTIQGPFEGDPDIVVPFNIFSLSRRDVVNGGGISMKHIWTRGPLPAAEGQLTGPNFPEGGFLLPAGEVELLLETPPDPDLPPNPPTTRDDQKVRSSTRFTGEVGVSISDEILSEQILPNFGLTDQELRVDGSSSGFVKPTLLSSSISFSLRATSGVGIQIATSLRPLALITLVFNFARSTGSPLSGLLREPGSEEPIEFFDDIDLNEENFNELGNSPVPNAPRVWNGVIIWHRRTVNANKIYKFDLNIDKLFTKVRETLEGADVDNSFEYEPQSIQDGETGEDKPNSNATECVFGTINISCGVAGRAFGDARGSFANQTVSTMEIDGLRITNKPR